MKMKNILYAMAVVLLPMSFVACGGDEDVTPTETEQKAELPEFKIGQDTIRVKIGAENKAALEVASSGGECRAFVLDTTVAKASTEGDKVMVEGFKNGLTNLVVSDKYNRYRRVYVSVYTTDVMTISKESVEMLTVLGQWGTDTLEVKGNGGFTGDFSNERGGGQGGEQNSELQSPQNIVLRLLL